MTAATTSTALTSRRPVSAAAALSAWRALTVGRAAATTAMPRLLLVGLGFLAAALLWGCSRSPPPVCCSTTPTAGSPSPRRSGSACRRCSGRRPRWTWTVASGNVPCARARICGGGPSGWPRSGVADRPATARQSRRGGTWERRGCAAGGHRGAAVPRGGGALLPALPARRSVVLLSTRRPTCCSPTCCSPRRWWPWRWARTGT